jgi:hypothetical protein
MGAVIIVIKVFERGLQYGLLLFRIHGHENYTLSGKDSPGNEHDDANCSLGATVKSSHRSWRTTGLCQNEKAAVPGAQTGKGTRVGM